MKRTSAALGDDSSPTNYAQSGQEHDPDLDQLLAKQLFPGNAPEKGECAALDAFLRRKAPSPNDFAPCFDWCRLNRRMGILARMQSEYPPFEGDIDLSLAESGPFDAIDLLTQNRIACSVTLQVCDAAMSLQLASWLARPQCKIFGLTLQLPEWHRLSNGSLVAGLGRAVAACPSIRHLTLCGPEQGKCELETGFITEAIANPELSSVKLNTGLAWQDDAWPVLGQKILNRMLARDDRGSISIQLAEAYANAIALNGAKSGYEVELGLSIFWRSPCAKTLESTQNAERCAIDSGPTDLACVVHRPSGACHQLMAQEPEGDVDAENLVAPLAPGRTRYLKLTLPRIPQPWEEKNLFGFLAGRAPLSHLRHPEYDNDFDDTLEWCVNHNCTDALHAIQVRYPSFIGTIFAMESDWRRLIAVHDLGITFDFNVCNEDPGEDFCAIASKVFSFQRVTIRAVTFDWAKGDDASFKDLKLMLQAVAKIRSVVRITLYLGGNDSKDQLSLLSDALTFESTKAIEFSSISTEIDCDRLRTIVEEAVCGRLQEIAIQANDDVLQTCVEAIAAAGSKCRLAKLELKRLGAADACNVNLGTLLQGQQSISNLSVDASIVRAYGMPGFEGAVLDSPSILRLQILPDAERQTIQAFPPAVAAHLQFNRKERYSEAVQAMLSSLVYQWSKGWNRSAAIAEPLQAVQRYLGEQDILNLAATSILMHLQFRSRKTAIGIEKMIDELIESAKELSDEDLRWMIRQFKLPLQIDPSLRLLRRELIDLVDSVLSSGIHIWSPLNPPEATKVEGGAPRQTDPELGKQVQAMVKAHTEPCGAVQAAMEGRQPGREEFQECVVWCGEMECMEIVAAIQRRWPAFSNFVHLDGGRKQVWMLEAILSHGIACDVTVTICSGDDLHHLEHALATNEANRTLSIVLSLDETVPGSLAQELAKTKLRGLCLLGDDRPVTLAPDFLPELLRSESIEQLTLKGEFITPEIAVYEACLWIKQSNVRSLHVQSNASLVDLFGQAAVAANGKLVDLELLSTGLDEQIFSWTRHLLHPKLGIARLVLNEKQLAGLAPWQWDDVFKINYCLRDLRAVTADWRRGVLSGKAVQMVTRNRAIQAQAHRWAVASFMGVADPLNKMNQSWVNQLSDYVAEPRSFAALRRVNHATAIAARTATESHDVAQDADRLALVMHRAGLPANRSLGLDRIVNHLRNHGYSSMTAAQYARLRSAMVDRIERYLDLWQAGRLPDLDVTITTTTTTTTT